MELTGTIMSQKISENEFSYWWCIPEFLSGYSYQSPKFGSISEEFSDCHLEIKTQIGLQQISRFFLISSKDQSETKFTFSASLEHGICPKSKGIYSIESHDLKPSVKIFAMDPSQHVFNPYFIFKLNLKLCKDLNATSAFSNSIFQDIVEKSGSSAKKEAMIKDGGDSKERVSLSSNTFEREPTFAQHIEHSEELIENLRHLYTSGAMSDLEIRTDDGTLHAHKSILGARSPVLKKMIENNCVESSSNTITITDCSAPAFEKFLLYLYTGKLEDRTLNAVMLFYLLSVKYDVPVLREFCSNILQDKFASKPVEEVSDIACDVLKLSELIDSKLKNSVTSFIVNNFPTVSNKQSWKELMKSNSELVSEILALVVTTCQRIQT